MKHKRIILFQLFTVPANEQDDRSILLVIIIISVAVASSILRFITVSFSHGWADMTGRSCWSS